MTIEEAITRYKNNAEYERIHGDLQGCIEFRQLADWLIELKAAREAWSQLEDGRLIDADDKAESEE